MSLSGFYTLVLRGVSKFFSRIGINHILSVQNERNDNNYKQIQLDKKLVYSLSKSRIPNPSQFKYIKKYLSKRELWIIRVSVLIIVISFIFLGTRFYLTHLQVVPIVGGKYVEALIGSPKYINPLYASVNDVDNDLSLLIFSSLFKRNPDGELINNLATGYEISNDNKTYTIAIRTDAMWHNGTSLTVNDIIFTFNAIKDSKYKSPLRPGFIGVEIEKIDEQTFRFILTEPYAAFLELLTFGILPRELWCQIPIETTSLAELNLKPVGSGLYKFKSLIKDKVGNIKEYHLVRNDNYYDQKPLIENITFKFFTSFEEAIVALGNNLVEGISYLPKNLKNNIQTQYILNFHELNLPELTALFFNEKNNSALSDKKIRQALALAINKNEIMKNILDGEARPISSPILPNSFAYSNELKKYNYNPKEAKKILDEAGWESITVTEEDIEKNKDGGENKENAESEDEEDREQMEKRLMLGPGEWREKNSAYLTVKLTTVDRGENTEIIEVVKNYWESIGVKTEIEIIEAERIQLDIIKPRNFEALFYGLVVGADPDVYVFWHSSQIKEGGLNIANYSNKEVDQLLEEARLTSNIDGRREKYIKFQEILSEDVPAIFMYSPTYTYVQSKGIKGFDVNMILTPHDRFANIADWYIKTGKRLVWD